MGVPKVSENSRARSSVACGRKSIIDARLILQNPPSKEQSKLMGSPKSSCICLILYWILLTQNNANTQLDLVVEWVKLKSTLCQVSVWQSATKNYSATLLSVCLIAQLTNLLRCWVDEPVSLRRLRLLESVDNPPQTEVVINKKQEKYMGVSWGGWSQREVCFFRSTIFKVCFIGF